MGVTRELQAIRELPLRRCFLLDKQGRVGCGLRIALIFFMCNGVRALNSGKLRVTLSMLSVYVGTMWSFVRPDLHALVSIRTCSFREYINEEVGFGGYLPGRN